MNKQSSDFPEPVFRRLAFDSQVSEVTPVEIPAMEKFNPLLVPKGINPFSPPVNINIGPMHIALDIIQEGCEHWLFAYLHVIISSVFDLTEVMLQRFIK